MSGIGQIDVNKAVELLIAAKSRKLDTLQNIKKTQTSKINVYDNIKKLINEFGDALGKLKTSFSAVNYNINSSNSNVATATASSNDLTVGTHTIVIDELAQSQQSTSNNHFASMSQDLNLAGTLQFTSGSDSFTVNVSAGQSLQNIVKSINDNENNTGITASLVKSNNVTTGDAEYRIVLNGEATGSEHGFTVSGDLASTFDFQNTQDAKNAKFTFDNLNETSASNTISDIVDGLTINLTSASSSCTITIKKDDATRSSTIKEDIASIVKKYNSIINYFDLAHSASETNVSQISFLKASFEKNMNSSFNSDGKYHTLLDLGIKLSKYKELTNTISGQKYTSTGSIEIDTSIYKDNQTKLDHIIANDGEALYAFFSNASDGFNKQLTDFISHDLLDVVDGALPTAIQSANDNMRYLDNKINDESNRLDLVKDKLVEQYSALNAKLTVFDSISKALEKQLSYLDTLSSKK